MNDSNCQIVPKSNVSRDDWDLLVTESPEGWLYQTDKWIELAGHWGSKSNSFGVRTNSGKLIAAFPLYRDDIVLRKLFRIKRLYTGLSGPVMASDLNEMTRKRIWKFMFAYVDQLAREQQIDILQVRLTTTAPAYYKPLRQDINPLFFVGLTSPLGIGLDEVAQPLTRVVYLEKTKDELFKELDSDCRAAVRQAERKGLQFVEGSSLQDVESYWKIHQKSWSRTGLVPHPFRYFEEMWDFFCHDRSFRFFFAESEGEKVSGIILHAFKQSVFYWGGCSLRDSLSLRPNNFLLWNAIVWAKSHGYHFFEIGQFYPHPTSNKKEYSVGKYKEQFGKDELVPFEGQKVYRTGKMVLIENIRWVKKAIVGPFRRNDKSGKGPK